MILEKCLDGVVGGEERKKRADPEVEKERTAKGCTRTAAGAEVTS